MERCEYCASLKTEIISKDKSNKTYIFKRNNYEKLGDIERDIIDHEIEFGGM